MEICDRWRGTLVVHSLSPLCIKFWNFQRTFQYGLQIACWPACSHKRERWILSSKNLSPSLFGISHSLCLKKYPTKGMIQVGIWGCCRWCGCNMEGRSEGQGRRGSLCQCGCSLCCDCTLHDTDNSLHYSYCSPVPLENAAVMLQDACLCVSGTFTWQECWSLNLAAGRGSGRQPQLVGLHSLIPCAGSWVSWVLNSSLQNCETENFPLQLLAKAQPSSVFGSASRWFFWGFHSLATPSMGVCLFNVYTRLLKNLWENSATRHVWSRVWGANCTQTNRLPVNLSAKCLGSGCCPYISQLWQVGKAHVLWNRNRYSLGAAGAALDRWQILLCEGRIPALTGASLQFQMPAGWNSWQAVLPPQLSFLLPPAGRWGKQITWKLGISVPHRGLP